MNILDLRNFGMDITGLVLSDDKAAYMIDSDSLVEDIRNLEVFAICRCGQIGKLPKGLGVRKPDRWAMIGAGTQREPKRMYFCEDCCKAVIRYSQSKP